MYTNITGRSPYVALKRKHGSSYVRAPVSLGLSNICSAKFMQYIIMYNIICVFTSSIFHVSDPIISNVATSNVQISNDAIIK